MDLVDGGAQVRRSYGQVHQPGMAVHGQVLLAEGEVQTHLLQDRELDFEELDRCALDRQVRLGDDRSSEQAHGLDGVLRWSELHIGVDALNSMDAQCGRPNAVDLDSEVGQEDAEVLDHVVRAGIAQHCHPSRQRRSEQRVLGDGVAAFGEGDRPGTLDRLVHGAVVEAVGWHHVQAEAP